MMKMLKYVLLAAMLPQGLHAQPQGNAVKRIYFNLYTDSIKTILNYYVNVEGVCRNGRILPMDTSLIIITADHGTMSGNEWIAPKMIGFEHVTFHASVKSDPAVSDDITVWLKRAKDPQDDMRNDDMGLPVVPGDMRKRRR